MKFRNEKQKYSITVFYGIAISMMILLITNFIRYIAEDNSLIVDTTQYSKEVSPMSFRVLNYMFENFTETVLSFKTSLCNHIVTHLISSGVFMILFDYVHTILQNKNMAKFIKLGMI